MKFKYTGNISYCIELGLYNTKTLSLLLPPLMNGIRYFVMVMFIFFRLLSRWTAILCIVLSGEDMADTLHMIRYRNTCFTYRCIYYL